MLSGALRADLGKQRRTASRQTATGISTTQQRGSHGSHHGTFGWRGSDADLIKNVRHCGSITATREPSLSIIKSYRAGTRKITEDRLKATTEEAGGRTCMTPFISA